MFAVYYGHPACVELQLEAGADPKTKSAEGDTPLMQAAREREDFTLNYRLRDESFSWITAPTFRPWIQVGELRWFLQPGRNERNW